MAKPANRVEAKRKKVLSPEEKKNIAAMTEQVKLIAGKVSVVETETETVVE